MAKRSTKESSAIRIMMPKPVILDIRLRGDSPLVVHEFDSKCLLQNEGPKPRKKEPRDPQKAYDSCFYRDPSGSTAWFRADGIKGAAVSACRFVDGLPMTQARGLLYVNAQAVTEKGYPLVAVHGEDGGPPDWEMVEHMVRLSDAKRTPDIRWRPMAKDWYIDAQVEFNGNFINADDVIALLQIAGAHVGIGEGRPERSNLGWGKFHVEAQK